VAIEVAAPGSRPITVETVGAGEVVGFSWLFEPYVWQFDARAVEPVTAIALDGVCLRGKCEEDPRLGYELMRRFAAVMTERLQATRLQLLDVYGHAGAR
jgi:CRP-like cAMP-binding protein